MYISKFTKFVIVPQNFLGVCAVLAPFWFKVSPWWILGAYLGWVFLGVFGVSTIFHKYYSHNAFKLKPQFRFLIPIFNYFGMLTGQGSAMAYAAIHRGYHHKYADRNKLDPHSPLVHSFWHSYYGWHFAPVTFSLKCVSDLRKDKFLVWSHRHYHKIYLISMVAIGLANWRLLLYGVTIPSLVHVHEMNILNSFCHSPRFGYRNFKTDDRSVNNLLFGLLTWGTGYHNNHHALPGAYHNQVKWFEFDPFRWIMPAIIESSNYAREKPVIDSTSSTGTSLTQAEYLN